MNLEEKILELAKYGYAMIYNSKHTKKWHCLVEMFIMYEGSSFEIRADGLSPTEAIDECLKRVKSAVEKFKTQEQNPPPSPPPSEPKKTVTKTVTMRFMQLLG